MKFDIAFNFNMAEHGFLQGHPYRNICDLRHGATTSLIEVEFASHTGSDADISPRVPEGLAFYTLNAQLRELELVFLNRFLQVSFLFPWILRALSEERCFRGLILLHAGLQELLRYIMLLLAMQPPPLSSPGLTEANSTADTRVSV